MEFAGVTASQAYFAALKEVMQASEASPRGLSTREVVGCSLEIEDPTISLFYHPARKLSLPFAVSEYLSLILGINDVVFMSIFNKNIANFSDNGITFNGAYGPRVSDLVGTIIDILKKDPQSRRAVVPIYNRNDVGLKSKDIPCTLTLQFLIRGNALSLIVNMRSNDIIWGTPYDIFQFTMLQRVVANKLGLKCGRYRHTLGSLHIYAKHYQLATKMLESQGNAVYIAVPFISERDAAEIHSTILAVASVPFLNDDLRNAEYERLEGCEFSSPYSAFVTAYAVAREGRKQEASDVMKRNPSAKNLEPFLDTVM